MIPAFVKRSKTERGAEYAHYLAANRERIAAAEPRAWWTIVQNARRRMVQLVEYDPDAEVKTVAAILYPHTDASLATLPGLDATLSARNVSSIIDRMWASVVRDSIGRVGPSRKPTTPSTFWRIWERTVTLHRHRMLTQERQRYTVRHGYVTPPELDEAGLARPATGGAGTSRRNVRGD